MASSVDGKFAWLCYLVVITQPGFPGTLFTDENNNNNNSACHVLIPCDVPGILPST